MLNSTEYCEQKHKTGIKNVLGTEYLLVSSVKLFFKVSFFPDKFSAMYLQAKIVMNTET